ncbi:MAG TPA: DUF447 family protein [Methanoculleus sp.]|nr:DUF447 family protein [Methanoculleus sp.]
MGLLREGINEVIATTRLNAAPMGIICRGDGPRMVLFCGSHTAANVERDGWVVANFVFDPVVFVQTAFDDLAGEAFVEEEVAGTTMHRLAGAEAWAAFRAEIERRGAASMVVRLAPLHEEVLSLRLHPVNRGFAGIVEATVHATRYVRTGDPWLAQLIEHHGGIVRKCGGPREHEALALLWTSIDAARE